MPIVLKDICANSRAINTVSSTQGDSPDQKKRLGTVQSISGDSIVVIIYR